MAGKKILIFSLQNRKKINNCINDIELSFDKIICTETNNARSMSSLELCSLFDKEKTIIIECPERAIMAAKKCASKNDTIAIIGTHYFGSAVSANFNISFNSL